MSAEGELDVQEHDENEEDDDTGELGEDEEDEEAEDDEVDEDDEDDHGKDEVCDTLLWLERVWLLWADAEDCCSCPCWTSLILTPTSFT